MCLFKVAGSIAIILNKITTHKEFALTSCPGPTQQAHSESLHTDRPFSSAQRNTELAVNKENRIAKKVLQL